MNNIYLICYDIQNDKLRLKISKKLIAYGLYRIQYSVFLGELSGKLVAEVRQTLFDILKQANVATDSVLIFPMTLQQVQRYVAYGKSDLEMDIITGQRHTLII